MVSPEREYCQIHYQLVYKGEDPTYSGFKTSWIRFFAKASGPEGNFTAAASEEVPIPMNFIGSTFTPDRNNIGHWNIHQNLIEKLKNTGWDLLPQAGGDWWARNLQRLSQPSQNKKKDFKS